VQHTDHEVPLLIWLGGHIDAASHHPQHTRTEGAVEGRPINEELQGGKEQQKHIQRNKLDCMNLMGYTTIIRGG